MARDGTFATTIAGFISYLAADYDHRQTEFIELRGRLEKKARSAKLGAHKRTPGQIADLAAAWQMYLDYATRYRSYHRWRAKELHQRVRSSLKRQALEQRDRLREANPVELFLDGLSSLLTTGRAHLAVFDEDDENALVEPEWGGGQGECLGFVDHEGVFLDPTAH